MKRSAKEESKYPLMEEYDFKNDHKNPLLPMDLRASTKIRVSCYLQLQLLFLLLFNSEISRPSYFILALPRKIIIKNVWEWES